jgi:CheY-like chemotaxis protein
LAKQLIIHHVLFDAEPNRFDLVLTDETMPDLTGTEFAREIRQLRPEISIIFMSGHSGTQLSERAQAVGVNDVIRKPLVRRDIAEPLAQALHESAGKQSRVEAHPSRDASPLRGE